MPPRSILIQDTNKKNKELNKNNGDKDRNDDNIPLNIAPINPFLQAASDTLIAESTHTTFSDLRLTGTPPMTHGRLSWISPPKMTAGHKVRPRAFKKNHSIRLTKLTFN
ncbi:hypothetical protein AAHE18_10G083900 [Arachis hypogaea]